MIKNSEIKLIVASTIGSIFEVFDFIAFVFLSPILSKVFFPSSLGNVAVIFTYIAIAISYLLRPLGGIILGNLGDKYGRKTVFSVSILLMSIPAFIIGILPTFAQIGYIATALLLLARLFQGFSMGGEVPGSITYIAEKFKHTNYFLCCAWLTFGANFSVAIGSQLIKLLINYTSENFMYSYGWRIPFLFGSLLSIVGFYIRKNIKDSQEFKQVYTQNNTYKLPIVTLFKKYRNQMLTAILLSIIVSLTTSIFHIFLPNLFVTYFNFKISDTAGVSSVGAGLMAVFSLLFAYLTKYIQPLIIIRLSLLTLLLILTLIFISFINLNTLYALYCWTAIISIALAGINGLFFGILAELFPTNVRFSGIGVCYNIAYVFGAGITPLWTSMILATTYNYHYIVLVCALVCLVSLANTLNVTKYRVELS